MFSTKMQRDKRKFFVNILNRGEAAYFCLIFGVQTGMYSKQTFVPKISVKKVELSIAKF